MPKTDMKSEMKRVAAGAALGAAAALLLAAMLTMFMALLVASGKVGEGTERAVVIASAFAATAAGALAARIKNHGAAALSGLLTAILAILLRILIGIAMGGGNVFDGGDMAVSLSILCGGAVTGAIGARSRRKRR